jgi:hypothetical protein
VTTLTRTASGLSLEGEATEGAEGTIVFSREEEAQQEQIPSPLRERVRVRGALARRGALSPESGTSITLV